MHKHLIYTCRNLQAQTAEHKKCAHMQAHTHTCTHTRAQALTHTCTYTTLVHAHTQAHSHIHMHALRHTQNLKHAHTHICSHMHNTRTTHTHIPSIYVLLSLIKSAIPHVHLGRKWFTSSNPSLGCLGSGSICRT